MKQNYKPMFFFIDTLKNYTFPDETIFIFDTHTEKLFSQYISSRYIVTIPAGEEHKTISSAILILEYATKNNLTRNVTFCAIGGGLVCDITAFCASIYKRGANLVLVPTTILSMVDAAIGGKTGCNFLEVKNGIGTFYTPKAIIFCFTLLETLPHIEFKNGIAEIIKIGLLKQKKIIDILEKTEPQQFNIVTKHLIDIIKLAIHAKLKIVSKDFTEKNIRALLNFGHTFAHALESISHFAISHGEAVAWGIYQELKLGYTFQITERSYLDYVKKVVTSFGFETSFFHSSARKIFDNEDDFGMQLIEQMKHDKKNKDTRIAVVTQQKLMSNTLLLIEYDKLIELIKKIKGDSLC
ncbi:MAG: 3-dehydroquinate synthase [Spirochaetaceae bacterium]|nr:3-dehydroquinate synthase [Spirochaetaceae bacterium]